jgi:hypothetical protein
VQVAALQRAIAVALTHPIIHHPVDSWYGW